MTAGNMPSIVAQALVEKLMQWNQLVQAREIPVEPSPALDLGGMGWLKIMWTWILPPARGYRVTGMLLQNPAGAYQLSVQRIVLAHNRVDLSKTLEKRGAFAGWRISRHGQRDCQMAGVARRYGGQRCRGTRDECEARRG